MSNNTPCPHCGTDLGDLTTQMDQLQAAGTSEYHFDEDAACCGKPLRFTRKMYLYYVGLPTDPDKDQMIGGG